MFKFDSAKGLKGGTKFQAKWLLDDRYKPWLQKVAGNLYKSYCKLCDTYIDHAAMGHRAISCHHAGKKHSDLLKSHLETINTSGGIKKFLRPEVAKVSEPSTDVPVSDNQIVSSNAMLQQSAASAPIVEPSFYTKDKQRAEVIWVLFTIDKNHSFASNDEINYIFQMMFPDSNIAKTFRCKRQKTSYLMEYGIYPYLQSVLKSQISSSIVQAFVILFDESLNENLKEKQLDIHIRFWIDNRVVTRYLTSEFLGKSTAIDLLQCFKNLDSSPNILTLNNMIQVSMDGPNVNILTLQMIIKEIMEPQYNHGLLDTGSCGQHQLHNAFKKGTYKNGFGVGYFLQCLTWLFSEAPARREEYELATGSSIFPLQFCAHRWVENIKPADRALEMLPHLRTYVKAIENKKKGVTKPKNNSYEVVTKFVKDNLAGAYLEFFISFGQPIEEFLTKYQSDRPMAPFLVEDLNDIIDEVARSFVKSDICDKGNPLEMDFSKKDILRATTNIKTGRKTRKLLKELFEKKLINEEQLKAFKERCRDTMISFLEQLKLKSPVNKPLATYISCLNPSLMVNKQELARVRFSKMCDVLEETKLLEDSEVDRLVRQYSKFLKTCVTNNPAFIEFDTNKHRLDDLFFSTLNGMQEYSLLWKLIGKILLLSHGQATVERGFSLNKEATATNQKGKSLIARRAIKDQLHFVGGVKNFYIGDALLKSCSQANSRYMEYLEQQKSKEVKENTSKKRKNQQDHLEQLRKKRKLIETEKDSMTKEYKELIEKCDKEKDMRYLAKVNALVKAADVKAKDIEELDKNIKEQVNIFNSM